MRIRQLQESDFDDAMALVRAANWNQCRADWRRLLALAPERSFVGVVDGTVVATTTAVTYDNTVSWVGMVLVHPDHRGNGYGSTIFDHTLATLDSGTAVGLDATGMGRPLYRRRGFRTAAPTIRFTGTPEHDCDSDSVEPLVPETVDALVTYDQRACGVDRGPLLERLHAETDTIGLIHDDTARGYAFLRPGRETWQIGPLVADDRAILESLLSEAATRLDGAPVVVDVPEPPGRTDPFENAGLTPDRRLERMTLQCDSPLLTGAPVIAAAGLEYG